MLTCINILVLLCLGCQQGTNPVIPAELGNAPEKVLATLPPEFYLQRQPEYTNPEFDRVLTGSFFDYHNHLDFNTLECYVDNGFDLSANLTFNIMVLPDYRKCDWQCTVTPEFLDYQRHPIEIKVFGPEGIERNFQTELFLISR